jgi:hypothetical protein
MARCDQGYLCRVCGEEVDEITESALYLRYVIGEIDPEVLHLAPESHLKCTPTLAQFIADPRFEAVAPALGTFAIESLDPEFVAHRRELVTRGYCRLWEIQKSRARLRAVKDYPLPEVMERWQT